MDPKDARQKAQTIAMDLLVRYSVLIGAAIEKGMEGDADVAVFIGDYERRLRFLMDNIRRQLYGVNSSVDEFVADFRAFVNRLQGVAMNTDTYVARIDQLLGQFEEEVLLTTGVTKKLGDLVLSEEIMILQSLGQQAKKISPIVLPPLMIMVEEEEEIVDLPMPQPPAPPPLPPLPEEEEEEEVVDLPLPLPPLPPPEDEEDEDDNEEEEVANVELPLHPMPLVVLRDFTPLISHALSYLQRLYGTRTDEPRPSRTLLDAELALAVPSPGALAMLEAIFPAKSSDGETLFASIWPLLSRRLLGGAYYRDQPPRFHRHWLLLSAHIRAVFLNSLIQALATATWQLESAVERGPSAAFVPDARSTTPEAIVVIPTNGNVWISLHGALALPPIGPFKMEGNFVPGDLLLAEGSSQVRLVVQSALPPLDRMVKTMSATYSFDVNVSQNGTTLTLSPHAPVTPLVVTCSFDVANIATIDTTIRNMSGVLIDIIMDGIRENHIAPDPSPGQGSFLDRFAMAEDDSILFEATEATLDDQTPPARLSPALMEWLKDGRAFMRRPHPGLGPAVEFQ
jgi:hypothetical protein